MGSILGFHRPNRFLILLLAASAAALPSPASGQPPFGPGEKIPPPDWMLYESAFERIERVERTALKGEAKGFPAWRIRANYGEQARLTEAEVRAIWPIALNCLTKLKEIDRARGEVIRLAQQERMQTKKFETSYSQLIAAQVDLRISTLNTAIENISKALGEQRAKDYYKYLRDVIAPKMSVYKF